MAEKNFAAMTSKKLRALMETASNEDKEVIQVILDARTQASTGETPAPTGETPAPTGETSALADEARKKVKLSDEEREALAAECAVNVNHKCQVIPFNTPDWVNGTIVGVTQDKRSNKVLYAIRIEDGHKIVKAVDSKCLKISDETVDPATVTRTVRAKKAREAWTDETLANEIAEITPNIGRVVTFTKPNGNSTSDMTGRVIGIVPDKRVQKILYRIEVVSEEDIKVTMHKVTTAQDLKFADTLDEEGEKINAAFIARREKATSRTALSPADRVALCEANLKKAEAALAKAEATLSARQAELEKAKAEFEAADSGEESLE